jgi:hypothetical protein
MPLRLPDGCVPHLRRAGPHRNDARLAQRRGAPGQYRNGADMCTCSRRSRRARPVAHAAKPTPKPSALDAVVTGAFGWAVTHNKMRRYFPDWVIARGTPATSKIPGPDPWGHRARENSWRLRP